MANGKSHSARRRDVRRAVPRPSPRWLEVLRQRDVLWASSFVLLLALGGSIIAVSSRSQPPYHLGQVLDRPVLSRVEFEAIDTEATQREREFASRGVPPVFRHNQELFENIRQRVLNLPSLADEPYESINPDYLEAIRLTPAGYALLTEFKGGSDPAGPNLGRWEQRTDKMLGDLFKLLILTPKDLRDAVAGAPSVQVVHPLPFDGQDLERGWSDRFLISADNQALITQRIESDVVLAFPGDLRATIAALVLRDIAPTYYFDASATASRRMAASEAAPTIKVTYRPDQVLIPSGTTLGADDLKLIEAEYKALEEHLPAHHGWLMWLGAVGLVLILGTGMWMYVFAYNVKVRRNPVRGLALTCLLLLCQGAAVLLVSVRPEVALGGVSFATLFGAVILAIVYDQRFAMAVASILTLLIVVSLRLPVTAALVMIVGVFVAVAQLAEIRSRSKLVRVGLWSGIGMGVTTFIAGLSERSFDLPSVWTLPLLNTEVSAQWGILASDVIYSLVAGISVGLLVQGLLPVIEKVFHVTTAMTLKELNDASHPLLQLLAQESAGTYQHSLRIADMSETAADAIGADGLLCRVGAMYHDIGKINKPQYFIENQGGGPNKHTKLSPAMSLLIIVGHVKDGIEMAREYNLPPVIRHFIESHHGTTLVEYFFHAAKKQKESEERPAPSEFEFRYPGPKPQTREAAIMLLCDGIEGAARAMDEPTPVRLEQLVHAMANKRLMDGQFDECNMTLRDLSRVEAAIAKTLCAIYHGRIKYPDGRKAAKDGPAKVQPKLA